jgi:hypothetical protein
MQKPKITSDLTVGEALEDKTGHLHIHSEALFTDMNFSVKLRRILHVYSFPHLIQLK